jgi:hypothetical protein
MEVLGHRQGGAHVLGAVDQQGRDVDPGEGVAEVLGRGAGHGPEADRVELDRAGPKASTDSGGVASPKIVGRSVATNSAGGRSPSTIAWRRRCSVTSAGRDPAQPA